MDYGLDLAPIFQADLLRDEKIAWAGQPDRRARLNSADIFLVPFSIVWGGFALLWESIVLGIFSDHPAPTVFALWGIPFVVVGQYFIWGRFVYKAYRNRHTFYAVTNRRVLILTTMRSRQLQSLFLNQIPTITKTVRKDGSGSISFGLTAGWAGMYANSGMEFFFTGRTGSLAPTFYDVADVQGPFQLIVRQKTDLDQTA